VDAADGGYGELLTLGVSHAEKLAQLVGSAAPGQSVGRFQNSLCAGLGEATAHAFGGQDQCASRITAVLFVVPSPRADPSPEVLCVRRPNIARVPFKSTASVHST